MRAWVAAFALTMVMAAGPARADMADAFGNTVVSHYADGGWGKHYFEPDGRYSAIFSDGRRITARWQVEGERICLNGVRPSMVISRFCTAMVQADVGQTWHSRDPLGRRVRNELLAGRR